MARRSESCPRLARKVSAPQAPSPPPLVPPVARACTLQDLGPEDKQKVAKLLKQVVDLGQEVQQLKQQRDEQAKTISQREQDLQESNRQLHKEHQSLKKKLGQVLLVLRASQSKVNALEAAQQALRDAQCSGEIQTDSVTATEQQQQQTPAVPSVQSAGGASVVAPETPAGEKPTGADTAAVAESTTIRASLAAQPGVPSLLHFAPGAHINITISHAPEPNTAAQAVPAAAPAAANAIKQTERLALRGSYDGVDRNSGATLPQSLAGSPHGVTEAATNPLTGAIIAIPTTTAAVAAATTAASSPSADVAISEPLYSSCCSPTAARSRGAGRHPYGGMADWQAQGPLQNSSCASTAVSAAGGGKAQREAASVGERKAASASVTSLGQAICRPSGPRNITVDATMQQFEAVPVHEVLVDSQEGPMASAMIVPPSEAVVAAASSLLGWQAQNGFGATDETATATSASSGAFSNGARDQRAGRKVLSYDPAIGKNGAFYFVDVADSEPEPLGLAAGRGATVAARTGLGGGCGDGMRPHGAVERWAPASLLQDQASAATAAHRKERFPGESPSSEQQHMAPPPQLASRPRTYAYDTAGGRPGLASMGSAPAALHASHAGGVPQQLQYPVRPAPHSPCSSAATEITTFPTPSFYAATMAPMRGCSDTPSSSAVSLSRMAIMLDEMARRQRWDVQPPPGVAQEPVPGGPAQISGLEWASRPDGAWAQGNNDEHGNGDSATSKAASGAGVAHAGFQTQHSRFPHGMGQRPHVHRHNSAGSGVASCDAASEAAAPVDSQSACGSCLTWLESNGVMERYDESLVDILSQADEKMEQHQHQYQHRQPRHQPRPQPHRPSAPLPAAHAATRHRVMATGALSLEGATSRTKQQAASMEALLAANLYEENDVLSVILEQEGRL